MNNTLNGRSTKSSTIITPKAASIPASRSVFNTFNRDWINEMMENYGDAGLNAIMVDAVIKCKFTGNIPVEQTSCIKIGKMVHACKDTANAAKKLLLEEGSWVENTDCSIHTKTHNTKRNIFTNKYKHFKYEIDTNKSLKTLVKGLKIALLKDSLGIQKRMLAIEKTNNRRTPTDIVACEETARHHYNALRDDYMTTVFLGVKSAGKIIGKSKSTGARYLKMLEEEGYKRRKNKFKLGSMDRHIFRDMEAEWVKENKFGRMFHSSTGLATLVFADCWTWNNQHVTEGEAMAEPLQDSLVKAHDLQGGAYYYDPAKRVVNTSGPSKEVMRDIEQIMNNNRSITC
jgi:hypothetical protein